ncbi:MAG: PilN domain-containing protein [Desulfamplus sp.]|nr:PilN domain-containing protein [Desulfamplus sp.]
MSEKILGLELSSDSLTAVVIKRSLNKYTIADSAWTQYDLKTEKKNSQEESNSIPNSIWRCLKWDSESFEDALKTLISELDLKGCSKSALCLPAYLFSFRTLNIPFTSDSKIRQILSYELASHLPISYAGYVSDFILLKESDFIDLNNIDNSTKKSSNKPFIFTASLPINVIDTLFSILKQYGIEPELVTSQGIVAANFINNNVINKENNNLVKDRTNLIKDRNNLISKILDTQFKKRINQKSDNALNVLIERRVSDTALSFILNGNIVAIRSFIGEKEDSFVEKTVQQTIVGLSQRYNIEIAKVNKIDLSDYGASVNLLNDLHLDNLGYFTSKNLHSDNFQAKNLQLGNFNQSNVIEQLNNLHWFNAIAAAFCSIKREKTINLCQDKYAKSSFFNKFKDSIISLSIFSAALFICLFINIEFDILTLKKEVKILDKAITESFIKTFPDVKNVVEPLMQMQVKIRELEQSGFVKGGQGSNNSRSKIRAIEILYELSNRIPKNIDIEVTRFLLSEGRLVIAGNTDNFNTIDKIKTLLEQYDRFKSVTINSANADKTGNRILFNFIVEFKE